MPRLTIMPDKIHDQGVDDEGHTRWTRFLSKFAVDEDTGSYKLKADGLQNRFTNEEIPEIATIRDVAMDTDLTRSAMGNAEWNEEKRLIAKAHTIYARYGARPKVDEELSLFVDKYCDNEGNVIGLDNDNADKCEWCRRDTEIKHLMSIHTCNGWMRVCAMCYAGFSGIQDPEETESMYDLDSMVAKDLNGNPEIK